MNRLRLARAALAAGWDPVDAAEDVKLYKDFATNTQVRFLSVALHFGVNCEFFFTTSPGWMSRNSDAVLEQALTNYLKECQSASWVIDGVDTSRR